MNDIRVSVIVLTYNHEKYLNECLDSIILQKTNFKYEVLVGNDNSPDETEKILNEYESKYPDIFKVYNRKVNLGATKNFLDLLKKVRGEYVILLEGDDYWTNDNKISMLVEFLDNNKEYIGVFHKVNEVDEAGHIMSTYPKPTMQKYVNEINSIEQFLKLSYKDKKGQVIHIQSIMYRNIYLKGIDDRTQKYFTSGKMIADIHTKLLILSMGKLKYLDENMGDYRRVKKEGGTSFSSQSKEFLFEETITIWNAINKYYEYKYNKLITKIIDSIYIDKISYYLYIKKYNKIDDSLIIFNSLKKIKIIIRSLILYTREKFKDIIK